MVPDEGDGDEVVAATQHDTAVVVVDEEPQLGRDRLADLAHVVEPVQLARERLEHLQVRDRPCVAGALLRRRTLGRALAVEHDLVLAVRLRGHHGGLRAGDQLTRVHRVLRSLGDADRDRHGACRVELRLTQLVGEPRRQTERVVRVARRHDHAELLAADPAEDVGVAHDLRDDIRDLAQQLVAEPVPVDVVDALEVVEVEHEHGDRVVRARRARELGTKPLVEVTVVVEAGQRVGLRETLEPRADVCVVEGERSRIAEPLGQLELVLVEARFRTEAVDVEGALDRAARDQRHDDQCLRVVGRARNDVCPRIQVGAVRPHRRLVRDGPAGQPCAVAGTVVHDLFLVVRRAREDRHQLAPRVVGFVDVKRVVGHQLGKRVGDAVEQRVEALLRHDVVEDLGDAPVRLDQRLRPGAPVRRRPGLNRNRCRRSDPSHRPSIGSPPTGLETRKG